ncbi:hypothetical protein FDZ73_14415 [bacterium]|nr:MAG: hypothetical protein FDZ73_14415 [bacterium]
MTCLIAYAVTRNLRQQLRSFDGNLVACLNWFIAEDEVREKISFLILSWIVFIQSSIDKRA